MGLCRQSFTVAAAAVTTALLAACTGGSSTASKPSGVPASPLSAQATTIDTAAIDAALGRTGTKMAGDVYRVSFPRADLRVVRYRRHAPQRRRRALGIAGGPDLGTAGTGLQ